MLKPPKFPPDISKPTIHSLEAYLNYQYPASVGNLPLRAFCRKIKRLIDDEGGERTCIYCGCTDSRACAGGCSWIVKHKFTPTGVCSNCGPQFVRQADSI